MHNVGVRTVCNIVKGGMCYHCASVYCYYYTDILQCITWSNDERQEGSHQELPMVIRGQIDYFDDITDDGVMMEDSPTPRRARVAFRQVINTGKAFMSQL